MASIISLAASIEIEADRAEIEGEKEEDAKKRKGEDANTKRFLGLSKAIRKVTESISDAAEREKGHQSETLVMLKDFEKVAAEGRLREDNMQEIIGGFKGAMQAGIEREKRVFIEVHTL
ncbi:hypothetical protein TWF788_008178 [Orbilia oligospora]|uniref:Uncharacterized protein n=1 Tax=Orbilia oligospora TaxID=2813651 RepID=A0A7C8U179_ORBOL|nr:hypothetical protein TWF788_008178 [Orbilia oligospora]